MAVLDVGFPIAAILLTHFMSDGYMRINVAGLLCVVFSMISYGSPLAAMVRILILLILDLHKRVNEGEL